MRVRVAGRWRNGVAHLLPEDDPHERQRALGKLNALLVRVAGTELLTVRIDLETDSRNGET